ncbi:MAG: hypothetical protein WBA82_01925 [Castellaniella sp.]|uniref:hypothetical protein n=1 Tax=Castellaniella sp. TaxID=1955812 RepID=UPI003C7251FB
MKKFKASLIATGVGAALAMAVSGPVFAGDHGGEGQQHTGKHQSQGIANYVRDNDHSAVATDHASATSVKLGDVSLRMYYATTTLNGTVQNNGSDGINGNMGGNGGGGGYGGVGNNGDADAHAHSKAIGGDGGNGGSVGASGGGHHGGGEGFVFDDKKHGDNGSSGGEAGNGGAAIGAVASGALAMAATGNGAAGGNGGSANGGAAGNFTVSNSIANSSFASAAGIMNVSQNTGSNALTQQGVTVQGNVSFR